MSEMDLPTAQKIVAERECRDFGCAWNPILANHEPVRFYCSRCSKSLDVTKPAEKTKYRQRVIPDNPGKTEMMFPDAYHSSPTMAGAYVGVVDEGDEIVIHTCYADRHTGILLTREDATLFAAEVARRAALAKED